MKDSYRPDYIMFEEAGAVFEAYGAEGGRPWWVGVPAEDGGHVTLESEDFPGACKAIDHWLAQNVASDHPTRFRGFEVTAWDHEPAVRKDDVL